ncbi:MAG: hypothetical protein QG672_2360 [Pseudomonadota bacterium]|nr:hypothetical protein [Pseudomonadota bacterium]
MTPERDAWQRWCEARESALAAPDSWLGLAGLYWLESKINSVGTDVCAAVVLPHGPGHLGDVVRDGDTLRWMPLGGEPLQLHTDRDGSPTLVEAGRSAFFVIEREGRLAVRVRDLAWAERLSFTGIERFDYDPAWRIEAEWQPLDPPQVMEVPNVTGELRSVNVAWQAAFRVSGQDVVLLPMSVSEHGTFFVFRDATSGRISYGAGRFLNTDAPANGRIVLDFNFACNPPCAFTPFATCPLPPPENWLPFAVEAGEKRPR